MLRALMSVKPLGNDFVHNVYGRGRWKDFNTCLVTDSTHPINETNLFSRNVFFKFLYCYFYVFRSDPLRKDTKGLKSVLLGVCPPRKGMRSRGMFYR